jgi:multiple sugar transport system substrate-binding protein
MTVKKLAADFLPVVSQDVILPTEQEDPRAPLVPRIYGLPLYMDTMVLFYNRSMLNEAGIASPATDWKSFQDQVKLITRLDETGAIIRSAAALGTADNVDRASDIVSLLMMQNGAPMSSEAGTATFDKYPPDLAGRQYPPGAEALIFYADFANPTKEVYTWNDKMPDSLPAFIAGKTAYFFGYSYHIPLIRKSNPNLNFGITSFPQIANNPPVNSANYWVEAVSNKSTHPQEAWEFVQFITAAEQAEAYLKVTKRPTALNALVPKQLEDLDLGPFATQLPNVRSWYHGTDTAAMEDTFLEMVRQALGDEADPGKIVELGATKVNQTIR